MTAAAVLVDRTAAWLHGVDVHDYREQEILPLIECVVLRDRSRIERPECSGGERDLAPYDVMRVHGLRVTTPLRTALDLGRLLPRPDGLAALDRFCARARHHAWSPGGVPAPLPATARSGQLRRAHSPRRTRSPSRLASRARASRSSMPGCRRRCCSSGSNTTAEPLFRLDLAYPRHRVAVEYDGEEWHDSTQEQRDADRVRRDWLERHGWTVIVVRRGEFRPRRGVDGSESRRAALRLA